MARYRSTPIVVLRRVCVCVCVCVCACVVVILMVSLCSIHSNVFCLLLRILSVFALFAFVFVFLVNRIDVANDGLGGGHVRS